MDPAIEYFFGTGDGPTTRWSGTADLALGTPRSEALDAIRLDFDGDGHRDDAMWDTDADGVADVAALDTDDDGVPDAFYRDSGAGLWDQPVARADLAGDQLPRRDVPDENSRPPAGLVTRIDLDDDGEPDAEIVGADRGGRIVGERLYVDSDADGGHDVVLVDTNGDGIADATYDRRDPRFTRRGR
ncbi:hypothetical protein CYJ73_12805 [Gordonia terrae]|uniref:Pullulanase n=1 Tax=Gordonia terrae TaxID=2055 RepID=A0A2I1R7R4_9ACTN|nr:hypothetical protein [Gordonia terrae]PKZ65177.1 hypothetical protein CYJ73_12805 [Gordonia terrae]UPW09285.1 hypothetical protein M1C59_25270 [Gordonia terrae]